MPVCRHKDCGTQRAHPLPKQRPSKDEGDVHAISSHEELHGILHNQTSCTAHRSCFQESKVGLLDDYEMMRGSLPLVQKVSHWVVPTAGSIPQDHANRVEGAHPISNFHEWIWLGVHRHDGQLFDQHHEEGYSPRITLRDQPKVHSQGIRKRL